MPVTPTFLAVLGSGTPTLSESSWADMTTA
jgi:hypothetical protein